MFSIGDLDVHGHIIRHMCGRVYADILHRAYKRFCIIELRRSHPMNTDMSHPENDHRFSAISFIGWLFVCTAALALLFLPDVAM